ncbi:MAG: hypothetical protein V1705_02110 [bacterium]
METFLRILEAVGVTMAILLFVSATIFVLDKRWRVEVVIEVANGQRDWIYYVTWPINFIFARGKKQLVARKAVAERKATIAQFEAIFGFKPRLSPEGEVSLNMPWQRRVVDQALKVLATRMHQAFKDQEDLRMTGGDEQIDSFVEFTKKPFWEAYALGAGKGNEPRYDTYVVYLKR